jgi:hypothetical protein
VTGSRRRRSVALNVKRGFAVVLSTVGSLLAVASIVLYAFPAIWDVQKEKVFHFVVLGLWLLGPPIWFVYESLILAKSYNETRKAKLKGTQELISKVWLGVSALLGVLASALKR